MAFNNSSHFFKKNSSFMNEEFNILPLFGFEHSSKSSTSVEDMN